MLANLAARAAERTGAAIEVQRAPREDLVRSGPQIPVEQIKMMRCFMHEKAAGMRHESMPAAEVVGAVNDVEIPVKVNGDDLANNAGQQHLLDRPGGRRETIVESDIDTPAGRIYRIRRHLAVFMGFSGWAPLQAR